MGVIAQLISNWLEESYRVRTTKILTDNGQLQHFRCDIGSGQTESVVTSANPLPVVARANIVDTNNTTTVALAAGATFTGTATDILNYNQIAISIFGRPGIVAGDGSSAKATFFFDFSPDGTNWDTTVPAFIRDPSLVIPIPLINVHRYFRVRYINDGGVIAIAALGLNETAGTPTLQTQFRLTTYLFPQAEGNLGRTMDQGISGSDPALLVRAGIIGRNPTQNFVNQQSGGVSNGNNSTTPLGIAGVFTGAWEIITGYHSITVSVTSNRAGSFVLQFSTDGTNVDGSISRTFDSLTSQGYVFTPLTKYCRIVYTNGATAQASFRLQTIFTSSPVGPIFSPIVTPLTDYSLAQQTRALLVGKAVTSGAYNNLGLSDSNYLLVSPGDFLSQTPNKTHVDFNVSGAIISGTAYTVTAGKTFYLTSIIYSVINAAALGGLLQIRDNLTVKIPVSLSQGVGATTSLSSGQLTFLEPLRFTTNVNYLIVAGTLTISLCFVGVEQ